MSLGCWSIGCSYSGMLSFFGCGEVAVCDISPFMERLVRRGWLWIVLCVCFPMCVGMVVGQWMEVTVVVMCLGWLRCSCGVFNFPFDGQVGWWVMVLLLSVVGCDSVVV